NLMDGLDGLAGGIAFIGFGTVVLSIVSAPVIGPVNLAVAWVACAALGAVEGPLVAAHRARHHRPPQHEIARRRGGRAAHARDLRAVRRGPRRHRHTPW
ncbi:MAG: hypothetical protein ABFS30_06775, partial [Pseudomonadota bacterium]